MAGRTAPCRNPSCSDFCEITVVALVGAGTSTIPVWTDPTPRGLGLAQGFAFGWTLMTALAALPFLAVWFGLRNSEPRIAASGPLLGTASIIAGAGALLAGASGIADRAALPVPRKTAASWVPEIAVLLGAAAITTGIWALHNRGIRVRGGRVAAVLGAAAPLMLVLEAIANPVDVSVPGERYLPIAVIGAVVAFAALSLAEARDPGLV